MPKPKPRSLIKALRRSLSRRVTHDLRHFRSQAEIDRTFILILRRVRRLHPQQIKMIIRTHFRYSLCRNDGRQIPNSGTTTVKSEDNFAKTQPRSLMKAIRRSLSRRVTHHLQSFRSQPEVERTFILILRHNRRLRPHK